jgi:Zn-finger nucleic acid-binding protein
MKCPICDREMEVWEYEGVEIDVCPDCKGVWLDEGELKKIVDTEEEKFSPEEIKKNLREVLKEKEKRRELMRYLMSFKKEENLENLSTEELIEIFKQRWGKREVVKCPKCGNELQEFDYAGIGVMIDRCPQGDGFWLEDGELNKLQIMMEWHRGGPQGQEFKVSPGEKKCPECSQEMRKKEYEGVVIDICENCGGVWLDKDELYHILETREEKFSQSQQEEVAPEKIIPPRPEDLIPQLNCPVCGALMQRFAFGYSSGIILDRCPNGDGVWLDRGELEKVQIYKEKSQDYAEKEYAKFSRIAAQAKQDFEARREKAIEGIKVSRFEAINRVMRWISRKLD